MGGNSLNTQKADMSANHETTSTLNQDDLIPVNEQTSDM